MGNFRTFFPRTFLAVTNWTEPGQTSKVYMYNNFNSLHTVYNVYNNAQKLAPEGKNPSMKYILLVQLVDLDNERVSPSKFELSHCLSEK